MLGLGREQLTVPVFVFDFEEPNLVLLDRFHQVCSHLCPGMFRPLALASLSCLHTCDNCENIRSLDTARMSLLHAIICLRKIYRAHVGNGHYLPVFRQKFRYLSSLLCSCTKSCMQTSLLAVGLVPKFDRFGQAVTVHSRGRLIIAA
jgi:hypothetical protein